MVSQIDATDLSVLSEGNRKRLKEVGIIHGKEERLLFLSPPQSAIAQKLSRVRRPARIQTKMSLPVMIGEV